jgi:hypothetical protein
MVRTIWSLLKEGKRPFDTLGDLGHCAFDVIELNQQQADQKSIMLVKVAAETWLSACVFWRNLLARQTRPERPQVLLLTRAARI